MSAHPPAPFDPETPSRSGWAGSPSRLVHEEHGFVLGFLTRALLWFAVLAFIGHDVGQIVWTEVRLSDAAHRAARAAANSYYKDEGEDRAEQQALKAVAQVDGSIELKAFRIDEDGSVWAETSEQATTLILGHIGFLRGFAERHVTAHEEHSPF